MSDATINTGMWQPIETAPKDGARILVTNDAGGVWVAYYKPLYGSGFKPDNPWFSVMLNHDHFPTTRGTSLPTHWMPLPAPPSQTLPQSPPLAVGPRADEDHGSNKDDLSKRLREFPQFFMNGSRWCQGVGTEPLCVAAADRIDALQAVVNELVATHKVNGPEHRWDDAWEAARRLATGEKNAR